MRVYMISYTTCMRGNMGFLYLHQSSDLNEVLDNFRLTSRT